MVEAAAPLVDEREVVDSGGHRGLRPFLRTTLWLAGQARPVEINLPPTAAACCSRCWSGAARWAVRSRSIPHAPSSTRSRSAHEARHPLAQRQAVFDPAPGRGRAHARPQRARARSAALLHAHQQRRLRHALQGPADRRLRRGDPARRRVHHPLRHRGAAPVRVDGQLHAESVRRDRARARDKLRCHQLLAAQGIGLLVTVFGDNPTTPPTCCRCSGRRRT